MPNKEAVKPDIVAVKAWEKKLGVLRDLVTRLRGEERCHLDEFLAVADQARWLASLEHLGVYDREDDLAYDAHALAHCVEWFLGLARDDRKFKAVAREARKILADFNDNPGSADVTQKLLAMNQALVNVREYFYRRPGTADEERRRLRALVQEVEAACLGGEGGGD
jgi:hypothetical protein